MFVGYIRVSTDRQAASGLGLEAQRTAIEQYAARSGREIVEIYVETESGKLKDRPKLNAALAHCRKTKATLLIAKLDRLARNVAFVSALMETGAEFVAVDAPFANKLMVHVLSVSIGAQTGTGIGVQ
jgi:DNA invertase Pin-like site-specific DNA recombinase